MLKFRSSSCVLAMLLVALLSAHYSSAQREGDDDDFNDNGFDDSGYNSPQNHDAEGSHQSPSNQSPSDEEDLDDDDDVDETHMRPQLASRNEEDSNEQGQQGQHPQEQQQQYGYPAMHGPQSFYNSPESMILANIAPVQQNGAGPEDADAYQQQGHYNRRIRRSISDDQDIELSSQDSKPALSRQKRHSKYIGPVYTYVKTDKHARFKWGVKHKVGKHGK